jgi:hypothetical protein
VFAQRGAFAFVSGGRKIVDFRYLDHDFGSRLVYGLRQIPPKHFTLPAFLAAAITINYLVMAAPVGDTFFDPYPQKLDSYIYDTLILWL